jgi:hypothetical protein
VRALLLALAVTLLAAAPASATLYEISGRSDGAVPSTKHPRPATDVHLEGQLLTALPDGSLAAVTGWIDSLVGIDVDGIAAPMKGARHLIEDPADIVPAPGGGVLVSNEEVMQRIAVDGSRSTLVPRRCEGEICATPWGMAPRPDGSVLFADTFNDRIRAVAPGGAVSAVHAPPVHWPFALGLLPEGGFMVAEGKPGHGRVHAGLRVWKVAADGTASVVAGGGTAARPVACGGTASGPLELDLRHMVDAVTLPDGSIVFADSTAGLLELDPDGSARVLACPAPKLARLDGDLRAPGFALVQVRLRVRHLAVGPDGTLYVVDGAGRVYADDPARLSIALRGSTISLSRDAQVAVNGAPPRAFPAGETTIALARPRTGITTLRIVARSGRAVATLDRHRIGRLGLALGRRLLRRELRRASRFHAATGPRGCRSSGTTIRCRRPNAQLRVRDPDTLEIRRGKTRWLAAP